MKNSNLLLRWSLLVVATAISTSAFGGDRSVSKPQKSNVTEMLRILDERGLPVPNSKPSAASQIFDVTVGPAGNRVFSPNTVNISVGDTVRWTWGSSNHSVTSGSSCAADSQFCSPNDTNCGAGTLSNTGSVYQQTFGQAGDYFYFCALHCFSGMTGTIHVAAAPELQLVSAASRKTHGVAGAFDIDLPLTGPSGVECRSGGANGDYILVFTFTNNVTSGDAMIDSGVGSVSGTPTFSGTSMTVNLTGIANAQALTVTLSNVIDVFAQTLPNTPVNASFLIGDTNGNHLVNASDISQAKSQIGQGITAGNAREDVNANGAINGSDVSLVKAHIGEAAPIAGE
ncbi:MAG: plastocyanin/azurin family copper-binding protein [Verrucomicrobiota bacterium]